MQHALRKLLLRVLFVAGTATLVPSIVRAQSEPWAESARVEAPSVHPVLAALGSLLEARLNPAERSVFTAIDARDTEAGSVQALLLAALDRLRPAVFLSFEAAGFDAPHIAAVRALTVRTPADAHALAEALEGAAAEGTAAAQSQGDAAAYGENALLVAAGIATQVSRVAEAIAAGASVETDEALADCESILDGVADVLDDASVLIGRREMVRLGFQVYRGAVGAVRGTGRHLVAAPSSLHVAVSGRGLPPQG